jgi:hypothetical protein
MPAEHAGSHAPPASLLKALRRLLRPLARLLLEHQITFPLLKDLLKEAFVEVAASEFPIDGRPQTDSRISLLTGIHRKDVRRLRAPASSDDAPPPSVSLGAQLVARWTGVREFLDDSGHPRPLPRRGSSGGGLSFEDLVQSVSRDIRPRAVLDEWLRLGVVHIDADERVTLRVGAFVPARGFDEKAFYFGRNLHDHVAAGAHNLRGGAPPLVDRSVYYGGLTRESVAELECLSERLGMDALHAVNRRALELQQRDANDEAARLRMNFGIYSFHAEAPKDDRGEGGDER